MRLRILISISMLICSSLTYAQTDFYCGQHQFDGEHQNEVQGTLTLGRNNIAKGFGGLSASYTRHFTDYFSLVGATNYQTKKELFSISGEARYRMPIGRANLWATARYLYSNYHAYQQHEHNWNVGLTWEARYWDLRIGCFQTTFGGFGSSHTEPITMQVGTAVNIKPREAKWNLGIFFRNYEEFYYEHWNINWGFHWNAKLSAPLRLFGELCIRPSGSMSQLASQYETTFKIGTKYVW